MTENLTLQNAVKVRFGLYGNCCTYTKSKREFTSHDHNIGLRLAILNVKEDLQDGRSREQVGGGADRVGIGAFEGQGSHYKNIQVLCQK